MNSLKLTDNIDKFIVIGDKVLIKPKKNQNQTKTGLYLPPGVEEKEAIHSGYIIKTGPGYPIPSITTDEEPWTENNNVVKYIPLQAQKGDLAIYLQKSGFEIEFDNEKYLIIPHSSLLMVIRDDGLFE